MTCAPQLAATTDISWHILTGFVYIDVEFLVFGLASRPASVLTGHNRWNK